MNTELHTEEESDWKSEEFILKLIEELIKSYISNNKKHIDTCVKIHTKDIQKLNYILKKIQSGEFKIDIAKEIDMKCNLTLYTSIDNEYKILITQEISNYNSNNELILEILPYDDNGNINDHFKKAINRLKTRGWDKEIIEQFLKNIKATDI